jgi:apolipoprotein N-acyltransferase
LAGSLLNRLSAITGWRKLVLALFAGALAALALPPLWAVPVLPVSFSLLLVLLDGRIRARRAFLTGFLFGFGYFAVGIYWIGFALLVDAAKFGWLLPIAVTGIAAVLGLFAAIGCLPAWAALRWRGGYLAAGLMLAAGWTALEWVRNWIFTGFPWNPVGIVWTFSDAMIQPASVIGVFGLSALTVLLSCLPAIIMTAERRTAVRSTIAALLLVAVWAGYGLQRLQANPASYAQGIGFRLVQANIEQANKWRRDMRIPNLTRLLALSADARPDWVTHVIWPETAATFFLSENPEVVKAIAGIAPEGGAVLTGAPRLGDAVEGQVYHNSLVAIDRNGSIRASYDKAHLVPFGEYVPLRDWLPLDRIVAGRGDFTPGPGPATIDLPGLPSFSPLICYEAIFPGAVVDADNRPAWMLNISNDAWFGISAGPHQHLQIARMRAVEEGLPLVRATNTGISAAFDPMGRETQRLDLDRQGVLDLRLPNPVASPTFFSSFGNAVPLCLALLFALGGMLIVSRSRRMAQPQANC